jgi:transketolase
MRSLPNMTVVVPADTTAVAKLLPQVADWPGPVYFRLNRNEVPQVFDDSYQPQIGKAVLVRPGSDITLIGTGLMLSRCLEAAEQLAIEGVSARVLEVHTLKPLDAEAIAACARETGAIVTAEEHTILGGLGGAVAEVLAEHCPVPMERVGLQDTFAECGPYDALLAKYGLDCEHVVMAARRVCQRKN